MKDEKKLIKYLQYKRREEEGYPVTEASRVYFIGRNLCRSPTPTYFLVDAVFSFALLEGLVSG